MAPVSPARPHLPGPSAPAAGEVPLAGHHTAGHHAAPVAGEALLAGHHTAGHHSAEGLLLGLALGDPAPFPHRRFAETCFNPLSGVLIRAWIIGQSHLLRYEIAGQVIQETLACVSVEALGGGYQARPLRGVERASLGLGWADGAMEATVWKEPMTTASLARAGAFLQADALLVHQFDAEEAQGSNPAPGFVGAGEGMMGSLTAIRCPSGVAEATTLHTYPQERLLVWSRTHW